MKKMFHDPAEGERGGDLRQHDEKVEVGPHRELRQGERDGETDDRVDREANPAPLDAAAEEFLVPTLGVH